jgi:hypothetical protein
MRGFNGGAIGDFDFDGVAGKSFVDYRARKADVRFGTRRISGKDGGTR